MEGKWPEGWEDRVGKFAIAVGKTIDEVSEALKGVVGEPGAGALEVLADESSATFDDLKSALAELKVPIGVLRKNAVLLRGEPLKVEKPAAELTAIGASTDVLPSVLDDQSFTEALKTGGILKPQNIRVIAAMKAAIANGVGLYNLPERILKAMDDFAEISEEPCTEEFYRLQKFISTRDYGDLLRALGVDSRSMSQPRKKALLDKLDSRLWNSIKNFHNILAGWVQAWMAGAANPAMFMAAMNPALAGGAQSLLLQPPDTSGVRDAAEAVINDINKIFSGTGIPAAVALAADAQRIINVLKDEKLPAAMGAPNREMMLKILGADIASDVVRMEKSITKYALAIMELPSVAAGQAEQVYLIAMHQLGLSIPWDKLSSGNGDPEVSRRKATGIGKDAARL